MTDEIVVEMKKLQFETAKVELEAKRLDLKNRPGDLRLALTNPVAIAAIIAAFVTLSSGIISAIVTNHQKSLETQRAQSAEPLERKKFESQLILKVVCTGDPDQAAVNLKFLVDTGLVQIWPYRLQTIYAIGRRTKEKLFLPIALLWNSERA